MYPDSPFPNGKTTEYNSHHTESNKTTSFEPTASTNALHTESIKNQKNTISSTQRTIGIILLCTVAVLLLCLTILGGISGILAGLLFGSPFILCGILCLTVKYRAGLWCAWTVYFCIDLYLRLATGINWSMIYITPYFEPSMNYLRLATAWIIFFVTLRLIAYTIRCFLKDAVSITKKHLILSVVIFLILQLLSRLLGSYLIYRWTNIISALLQWGIMWAVIGVGVSVIRYVQNKKRN